MTIPSSTFALAREAVAGRQCRVKHCHLPHHGVAPWCMGHLAKANRYGHPGAHPVKRSELATYRPEVSALLVANESHAGLLQVLSFIDRWMAEACHSDKAYKGAREIARLRAHGITSRALLVEFLAASLWLNQHGHRLPDDRSRDFFISRAVFGMVPRVRRATGGRGPYGTWGMKANTPQSYSPKALPSGLAHVGRYLRQTFAVFTVNVMAGVEAARRLAVDPLADQRAPLVPSKVGLLTGHPPDGLPFPK